MAKHIARVTFTFDAPIGEGFERVAEIMAPAIEWAYVSIDGTTTAPIPIPEPSLDELFDEAWENE